MNPSPPQPPETDPPSFGRSRRARLWAIVRFPFRWGYKALKALAALLVLCLLVAAGGLAYFLHSAHSTINDIAALTHPERAPLPQPVRIYSADNQLLGQTATQERIVINSAAISPRMRQATIAIEDQRFYQHQGVDWQGIARALWINYRAGGIRQGASTITQQYIRNVYLDFQQTRLRKVKEIALALQLEGQWSKQRILDAYLNTIYFANGRYGIEAASRYYFGRPAARLDAAQAATLAGIVKNPSAYDPRVHPNQAKARRNLVLDEMFAQNMLSRAEVLAAKRQRLGLRRAPRDASRAVPERQLFDLAMGELRAELDPVVLKRGGLVVHTSIDLAAEQRARWRLAQVYASLPRPRPLVAATFLDPRSGRVVVAASSQTSGYFNIPVQARRQPGSTVKAFTLATLLTRGRQLADPVNNSPLQVEDGQGQSYTITPTSSAGTIQDALRFSQNPAFWRLYQQAGPRRVLALERRLGLTDMDANPAAALGGTRTGVSTWQLASAYGAIGNSGRLIAPHVNVRVEDMLGNRIWSDSTLGPRSALAPEYARTTTQALLRVVNDGFPQLKASLPLASQRQIAGKTGTTENNADAWFVGMTPQLAGAVWTGYRRSRQPLRDVAGQAVFGATVPAQTWNALAKPLLAGAPKLRFPAPRGIQRVPRVRGLDETKARQRLTQFGFLSVTTTTRFDASRPDGTVLALSPAGGAWVARGRPVALVVSTDRQPMPALVGSSYADFLENYRGYFTVTVRLRPSGEKTGTILRQSLSPDAPVAKGAALTLVLATRHAPPLIKKVPYVPTDSELARLQRELAAAEAAAARMPNVVGLSAEDADTVLASLDLRVDLRGDGIVLSTDPAAGEPLRPGARIIVTAG